MKGDKINEEKRMGIITDCGSILDGKIYEQLAGAFEKKPPASIGGLDFSYACLLLYKDLEMFFMWEV